MLDLEVPIRVLVRNYSVWFEPSVVARDLPSPTNLGVSVMEVGYGTPRGDPAH